MIGLSCGFAEPRLEAEFELEGAEAGFEVEGADVDIMVRRLRQFFVPDLYWWIFIL